MSEIQNEVKENTPADPAVKLGSAIYKAAIQLGILANDRRQLDGPQLLHILNCIVNQAIGKRPVLKVWYGSMPETNGKTNWTAILYREGDVWSGITLDRSEYPDRVRYEADRMRYLIGEIDKEPFILDYDTDKCEPTPDEQSKQEGPTQS